MARITYVKSAQQRYRMVPVLDEDGKQKVSPVMRRNGEQKTNKAGRPTVQRQTVADKSQPLPMPTCGKCGKTIEVGQPYKHVTPKSGPYGGRTMYRCADCPSWKQSELTFSKMAGIYAMQEHADEMIPSCDTVDDLTSLATDLAEMVREVANEYRESQENMESGFGHSTSISDELGEKADELENWADEIESTDFDEFEGDEEEEPVQEENESDEDFEARHDEWEAAQDENDREQWIEEQRERLIEIANECPI